MLFWRVLAFEECELHHQSRYQPDTPACLSHRPASLQPWFCLHVFKGGGDTLASGTQNKTTIIIPWGKANCCIAKLPSVVSGGVRRIAVGEGSPDSNRSRLRERFTSSSTINMTWCPLRGPFSASLSTLPVTGVHEGQDVGHRDTPNLHLTTRRTIRTRTDWYTNIPSRWP